MATLVFKLFSLTLKTVSKPLANRLNGALLTHPVVRQRLVKVANFMHRVEVRITRGAEGRTGKAFIADMDEEHAMEVISKFITETFLYSTAVLLLLLEQQRKANEDEVKQAKTIADRARVDALHEWHLGAEKRLSDVTTDLQLAMKSMEERLETLERMLTPPEKTQRSWSFR
ncbi:hypothetical protein ACKKBG_A15410 [Auxenochlorella protothecoides x Auxenochlorella symbiontica]